MEWVRKFWVVSAVTSGTGVLLPALFTHPSHRELYVLVGLPSLDLLFLELCSCLSSASISRWSKQRCFLGEGDGVGDPERSEGEVLE